MTTKTKLFRTLLLEVAVYSVLVAVYFFLVLHFIGHWLLQLFAMPHKFLYATVALLLMVSQGILLEVTTTFLLRYIRGKTE